MLKILIKKANIKIKNKLTETAINEPFTTLETTGEFIFVFNFNTAAKNLN